MTRSPIELLWTAKNTNDDNDGCNNSYEGNFDDNDDKNYQKTNKYKVLGRGLPPPIRAMTKRNHLFMGGVP